MQPQLGQVSFSLEIELYVGNIFELVMIMIVNLIFDDYHYCKENTSS